MAFGIPGTENIELLKSFSGSGLLSGLSKLLIILVLFLIVGGIFYFIYYKKNVAKNYNKKIFWFEEVNGDIVPTDEDKACELIIPGTNIQVFYIKEKDLYLPRPVKRMGKDSYWFVVKNNREIVNFKMKNINDEMKEANLDYDHTDMRYALTNLKDLIQRNYRDKSQPWWREYKEVISLIVLIFVMTLSFIFIISKVGSLIDRAGELINHADQLVQMAEATKGSGVVVK